ncbi:MAG: SDR family oxidoreductase [Planctomycetota bacterium]|nr:SDR family oxidoreductase [Planctomycetota bacterium]
MDDIKKAVITGASRGIGRAIAVEFARRGMDIALLARDTEGLAETERLARRKCEHSGRKPEVLCVGCDLSDSNQIERAVAEIAQQWPILHVLVNNAGTNVRKRAMETDEDDWDKVLALNLKAAFSLSRRIAPLMVSGGRILNIGSIAGVVSCDTGAAYSASKAAVSGSDSRPSPRWNWPRRRHDL